MALDYILVGINVTILVFYLITLFLLLEIKARVSGKTGYAFFLLMIGVFVLILRRLERIFFISDLITIPYFKEVSSLIFSVLIFYSSYLFYKSIIEITDGKRSFTHSPRKKESFRDYKKKLGKIVKY